MNPMTLALAEWIQDTVIRSELDLRKPNDMDRLLLSKKPSQRALCYSQIMAFGNHFHVEDEMTTRLLSYNSGAASMFQLSLESAVDSLVNYVGVLKDILQLDYGALHTQINMLHCEWVKPQDSHWNPTYVRDESGFLVVNFCHKIPRMLDPLIFPSQATHVFFSDVKEKPRWKVVLHKEARSKRDVGETVDTFINTMVESAGLTAPRRWPTRLQTPNLVGAIELSPEDNLLAHESY